MSTIYSKLGEEKWSSLGPFFLRHGSLLPLILGKWSHFEEKNIVRIAEKHLDDVFSPYLTLGEVYEAFFYTKPSVKEETAAMWIEVLKDDPDIRN